MNYAINNKKEFLDIDNIIDRRIEDHLAKLASVGDICIIDGIETVCFRTETSYKLFVDRNHDLIYYFDGNDYSSQELPENLAYEWGGYGIETGIQDTDIGAGLSNTDSLIEMNLSANDGREVVWNKIKEFREAHSDRWFLPSYNEIQLFRNGTTIYNSLNNIALTTAPIYGYYLTSTEFYDTATSVEPGAVPAGTATYAVRNGSASGFMASYKNYIRARYRLCCRIDLI